MKGRMFGGWLVTLLPFALCPVALSLIAEAPAHGQAVHATGPHPSFEVATIKPAQQGGIPPGLTLPPPNIFRNLGVTARDLVRVAYGLPSGPAEDRVLGGPSWVDTNRYDIDGKIPDALFGEMQKMAPTQRRDQMFLMVQALLADRFKLVAHIEMRELPIYELVVAKGGPKLTPAKEPPPESVTPPPPLGPGNSPRPEEMRQGLLVRRKTSTIMEMTAKAQTLDDLAQMPFFGLGRPVVNKTELAGKYDFILDWTPEPRGGPATSDLEAPVDSDAPSVFTALQEQLGLKLAPTKGPVEVIVIDHVEKPSEN
jgi:bla regulator protein BlaR1